MNRWKTMQNLCDCIKSAGLRGQLTLASCLLLLFSPCCTRAFSQPTKTLFPNSKQVSPEDLECMQRQTGQRAPADAALGIPSACKCQHGFPQAFAMDPNPSTGRINSGLVKLTCPHLVTAIDALEDDGFIQNLSKRLEESIEWQGAAAQVHEEHAAVRKKLLGEENIEAIRSKLGDKGTEAFLNAGVAGSTPNSLDVKCLHAWMGDHLFRIQNSGDESGNTQSPLGHAVNDILNERGLCISGTSNCKFACDPRSELAATPPNPRNKQRLKTRKEIARRKRRKKEID